MSDAKEMDLKDMENITGGVNAVGTFDKKKKDEFDAVWNKMTETKDISGNKRAQIFDRWEAQKYPVPIDAFIKANI